MLTDLKAGKTITEVAQTFSLTEKQILSKWADLYLKAQEIRIAQATA